MARVIGEGGGKKKKPPVPEVPTPVISPLPLPQLSPLVRNLLAGSPSAVNTAGVQQQAVQQPTRQLTQFEIMRNAIAGRPQADAQTIIQQQFVDRNIALIPQPATPAAPPTRATIAGIGAPTTAQLERAMTVAGQGADLARLPSPAQVRALESGQTISEFLGVSQPQTPEQQALSFARQFNAADTLNTIEAAAGNVFVQMTNNVRPPFILFGVQERLGWTDQQMIDAGYERTLGGWVRKPVTGRISDPVVTSGGGSGGGVSIKFPSFGGGSGRSTRPGSGLINWRI